MLLVTGATGNVGREVVNRLVATGVSVRAMVRNPAKAAALEALGIEIVFGDFERPATLGAAVQHIEKAFLLSSLDPRQMELQGNFIAAAQRAGVQHIVKLSVLGADPDSPLSVMRWHGQTEKQLEATGIAWTHLRPGYFMQNMLLAAPTIKAQGAFFLVRDKITTPVDTRDVAAVAAKTLTEPGHDGRAYTITGPEILSFSQIVVKLSQAIGKPVRLVLVPSDDYRRGMLQARLPVWLVDIMAEFYGAPLQNDNARVTNTVSTVVGRTPISFDQFAREYAHLFKDW
jgi:uncharacterized protein YbjT (DUF2867 family)